MQLISELSNDDIRSALSSVPSGIITPTLEALSNMRNPDLAERLQDERRKKDSQVMGIVVSKWFGKIHRALPGPVKRPVLPPRWTDQTVWNTGDNLLYNIIKVSDYLNWWKR